MSRSRLNNRATMEAYILTFTGRLTPEAASVAPCLLRFCGASVVAHSVTLSLIDIAFSTLDCSIVPTCGAWGSATAAKRESLKRSWAGIQHSRDDEPLGVLMQMRNVRVNGFFFFVDSWQHQSDAQSKPFLALFHRGPTDVEDDRPPHPKMARVVSASGLYGSIVAFHAVKFWVYACKLTNY